jgi:ClpP class serine protease
MPLTQEDRDALQAIVDARYALFVQAVAKQRQLSIELAPDWADGKQFCGFEACEKKLIDQVGGYSDAVQKLTELM